MLSSKILVPIFLVFSGIIVYQQIQISRKEQIIEKQIVAQKELADNITRSMNELVSKKEIEQFIKENNLNLKIITEDLNKLHANISAANAIVVKSGGQKSNNLSSTNLGPANPVPTESDRYGYLKRQQNLFLNEDFNGTKIPIGQVGFSAWQEKPWSLEIKPREYHLVSVVGTDENQRSYFYNKFFLKIDGKNYDVKISSAETKQELPEPKFSFWNPRLLLGVDAGINVNKLRGEIIPNLSLGIMSYGKFKKQPDFSILNFGLGYGMVEKSGQISISPVVYNIGKHLPLINNTYFGPSANFNLNGDLSLTVGIKVGL